MHITCASEETLIWVSKRLSEHDIHTRVSKETDKKFRLNCTDSASMRIFVSCLYYKENIFCLQRKLEKVKYILASLNRNIEEN